jgi:hypothetical protein
MVNGEAPGTLSSLFVMVRGLSALTRCKSNTVKMLVDGSLIFMSIKIMDFKIKEI